MPCFTYGTNDPQYIASYVGQATVELTYAASGTTYSFSQIARLCSIPNKEQIKVWKKATPSSLEVEQVYSDTTFADGYFRIVNDNVILGVAAASGQVIIRRATPNSEMFINFTEGAKLSAEQLNLCFAQLLFIAQEKEFIGSTNNHFYPIANSYTAYSAALSYSLNAYVSYPTTITDSQGNPQTITRIYKCIAPTTPGIPPTNGAYWEPVSYTTNGFVIEGAPLSAPVRFDLSNVEVNHGLIWDGGKFSAGYLGGGTLDSLSDVVINTPLDKQLLQYNNSLQVWQNTTLPLKFGTSNSTLFQGKAYYDSTSGDITNQSFVVDGSGTPPISAPATNELSIFKTNTNNWVIPNPPTVYHILKRIIPNEQDPIAFFDDAKNAIDEVAVNLGNPVKVKFFWNLWDTQKPGVADTTLGLQLDDFSSSFWDKPQELYNINMYTNAENLLSHGIVNSSIVYKTNPYWRKEGSTFYSKIHGYGLTANGFYLSVPECYTSSLGNIPIITGTPTTSTDHTYFVKSNLGTENPDGYFELCNDLFEPYEDLYLRGLREMLSGFTDAYTYPNSPEERKRDERSRHQKKNILAVVYNGLEDISFKRLETSENAKNCLWKIPKNIIYVNKHSLAWSNKTTNQINTNNLNILLGDSGVNNTVRIPRSVRFTGTGKLSYTTNANSSTSTAGRGFLFKANSVWENWCSSWDYGAATVEYQFNEADIDWRLTDLSASTDVSNLGLLDFTTDNALLTRERFYTAGNDAFVGDNFLNSQYYHPWEYRPNNINTSKSSIGTHLFNIDANSFFSEAHNFIPDPVDEYVFRLVVDSTKLPSFQDVTSSTLKSTIILEHGFTEQNDSFSNSAKTLVNTIFSKHRTLTNDAKKFLDKSKVKVFVQNEHVETVVVSGNTATRYVITLCVQVPRLKSIGYARVFRRPYITALYNNGYNIPGWGAATNDTYRDSGSWLYGTLDTIADVTGAYTTNSNVGNEATFDITTQGLSITETQPSGPSNITPKNIQVSGRNECAVKFTRMGIPSNLWIRLSVLNSDGTTSLINSSGQWTT